MKRFTTVEDFILGFPEWSEELKKLRHIALSTGLTEAIKWGAPAYLFQNKIVLGIGAFKSYVGLWFHQGGLLKDETNQLMNAQEGKTKALRQWRFDSAKDINEDLVSSYIYESIENFKLGKEIKPDKNKALKIPPELVKAFGSDNHLKSKFNELSKSKQREYADHISDAKRLETKLKRLEKIIPMINSGIGLHDKYKNC